MKRSVAVLLCIVFASLAAIGQSSDPGALEDSVRRPRPRPDTRIKQDLTEALTVIQQNYVGHRLDYNEMFKSSVQGMLRALDPHSTYFDKKEFDEQQAAWSRSEYYGIGASIAERRMSGDKNDTYILATFDQSPAFRAGLRYGDRIVAVNDNSTIGQSSAEVRDQLRGPRGTKVRVTVERAANGAREAFEIMRDAVPQPTVPDVYVLRPGIGYIDMTRGFNRSTGDEFIAALQELKALGATSIILDLRNNSGGFIVEAVKVAERFLGSGQRVVDQRGTGPMSGGARVYNSTNRNPETLPVTVLINRASASAAEILAGALQDQDRALIVGETSFGKGLVQTIYPLEYGGGLTLTTARYHTPSGRVIQRDYGNMSLYDYYSQGGVGARNDRKANAPKGPASLTAGGRLVYGGGITPDQVGLVEPRVFTPLQQRLIHPVFGFVREAIAGRLQGFESLKLTRMPDFTHGLESSDLIVDNRLFDLFKEYVAKNRGTFKFADAQLERQRDFLKRQIRYDLAVAWYGIVRAQRVFISDDPQVLKAIELVPQARELSRAGR
ncbi:MAG TPA: S41 family peptidase [Pyrinomonadaceae bacterium]|nr:S41 family peptidase [Pyrinomonadaceae bacterium]